MSIDGVERDLSGRVQELEQELGQARDQQRAMTEILIVISRSPTDAQSVFDTIAASATRLCEGFYSAVFRFDGEMITVAADSAQSPRASAIIRSAYPSPPGGGTLASRALLERRVIAVTDAQDRVANPVGAERARAIGYRAGLSVPMLRGGTAIGAINVVRREPIPFTDTQIELLKTFADQAVIAINNVGLFEEVQTRTKDLQESLEYQTAIADVLNVISRSPHDLQPVFDTIVATAERLCEAEYTLLYKQIGNWYGVAAANNADADFVKYVREHPPMPGRGSITGRTIIERRPVHIPDCLADPEYLSREHQQVGRFRTMLSVPLLREGAPVGVISLLRAKVRPFSQRQIDLVTTFADQAVIAIENARLFEAEQASKRELQESLEYQTATSEVLGVIGRSKFDLQPVLEVIVSTACGLCDTDDARILLREGESLKYVAGRGSTYGPDIEQLPVARGLVAGRAVIDRVPVHVPDLTTAGDEFPQGRDLALLWGHRTTLAVPLLRDGEAIGCFFLRRLEVRPYTDKQIELLRTFADQAVIAIENARLFEAEQTRTKELQESLEYQTATSDVLGVISRSPNELQPVLDTIARTAQRLCQSDWANVWRLCGSGFELAASNDPRPDSIAYLKQNPVLVGRSSVAGRCVLEQRTLHIPDRLSDPEFPPTDQVRFIKARTMLGVPLMRQGAPIGAIVLIRGNVRPFTDRQVELVETFADQAVIAINNVGLFEEVQARTKDLEASLDRQTATGDVLSAISRSPSQTQPVFDVIVATAARLCRAEHAVIFKREGDGHYHVAAANNAEAEWLRFVTDNPIPPGRGSLVGRTVIDGKVVHIPDCLADPEFTFHTYQRVGKFRTMLGVPLMHQGSPAGVIGLLRNAVEPFSDTEIDLVTTFADQAVIAIENARLFEEVQARTRELTRSVEELRALGQVGQTVSSSLDPQVVLPRILEHACDMSDTGGSDTGGGAIYVFDKVAAEFHLAAGHNMSEELIAAVREHPILLGESLVGQCAERRAAVQFADLAEAPPHPLIEMHIKSGVRALLAVPLLHQDEVVGALVVRRRRAGAFADPIVNLMQTFANQSAIAVHNARLFREIEDKSRQLEIASQHKSQFVANMSHELRTPLAAMLGYAELLQENIYGALPAKATPIVERIRSNGRHLLGLINTVLDISKIESGQFKLNLSEYALSSMVETVRVATESLAAGKKLAFHAEVAKGLPHGLGDEQRLTQVLLNLVGNAIKFTDVGEVRIRASVADGRFTVAVSDTGPGIPAEERNKVFEKFHQIDNSNTKAKGGTGLGLAIAKDIVEMHGGRIWVESTFGQGATFHLELPVRAVAVEGAA